MCAILNLVSAPLNPKCLKACVCTEKNEVMTHGIFPGIPFETAA